MSTNSRDKQRKLNTTPLSKVSETPDLLSRRKRHRSRKRQTKEEIQYQRFVHDLQKNIKFYMKDCLRESHFDTRDNHHSKTNPSYQFLRPTLTLKQTNSTTGSHDNGTVITSTSNRQDPLSFFKYNESKRLAADVQTILNGPAMKNFYTQFIRPIPPPQKTIQMEESFLNISDP